MAPRRQRPEYVVSYIDLTVPQLKPPRTLQPSLRPSESFRCGRFE